MTKQARDALRALARSAYQPFPTMKSGCSSPSRRSEPGGSTGSIVLTEKATPRPEMLARARKWLSIHGHRSHTGCTNCLAALLEKVAAEERESCAKVADSMLGNPSPGAWRNIHEVAAWNAAILRTVAAIRAMGERPPGRVEVER